MSFVTHYQRSITALLLYLLLLQSCQSHLHMAREEATADTPHDTKAQQKSISDAPAAVLHSTSVAAAPPYGLSTTLHASSTHQVQPAFAAGSLPAATGARPQQDVFPLLPGLPTQQTQEYKKLPAKRQRTDADAPPTTLGIDATANRPYDIYISSAREDQTTIAELLHVALKQRGIKSFIDRREIWREGNGPAIMKKAMENALCGVFVLSPEFITQPWPMQALYCFLKRRKAAEQQACDLPCLFPIFYRLFYKECSSPTISLGRHNSISEQYDFNVHMREEKPNYKQAWSALQELSQYDGIETNRSYSPQVLTQIIANDLCTKVKKLRAFYTAIDVGRKLREYYLHDDFALVESLLPENSPRHARDLLCTLQLISKDQDTEASRQLHREPISTEALFTSRSMQPGAAPRDVKKVLIIGNPGVGKTTLSKHLAYRWAVGSWGKAFKAVYVLPIRNLQEGVYDNTSYRKEATLATAIVNNCFAPPIAKSVYKVLRQKVSEQLQEPTTLVVLDGLDERLGASETLVAQAMAGSHKLLLLACAHRAYTNPVMVDIKVEHIGLSITQVRRYVKQCTTLSSAQGSTLLSLLGQQRFMFEIARVPVNLQILCFSWGTSASRSMVHDAILSGSLPRLYRRLIVCIWKRYMEKVKAFAHRKQATKTKLHLSTQSYRHIFDMLGNLALGAFKSGTVLIGPNLVRDLVSDTILQSLPAMQDAGLLFLKHLGDSGQYKFLHVTFQEYFGGRCLAKQLFSSCGQVSAMSGVFLVANRYVPAYGRMFSFMAGEVSKEKGYLGLRRLLTLVNAEVEDTNALPHLQLQVRLLDEWLCISAEQEVSRSFPLLEKEFKIFLRLQEQLTAGINLVKDRKENRLLPLLVEMLEEFRSVARYAVPSCLPCLLAACDPAKTNSYTARILEDTLVWISALSASRCFEVLVTAIRGAGSSVAVRKVAILALGSLVRADNTLLSQIVSFLRSARTGPDLAIHQAARTALRSALNSPAASLSPVDSEERSVGASPSFGKEAWSKYFGDVGKVPPLPYDIEETLESACPFWPGRKVRDTHLLVLIPAMVGDDRFTLYKLGTLVKKYFPVTKKGYRYYDAAIKRKHSASSPDASYWILLTREILLGSRGRSYSAQKALVSSHATRTGLAYRIPSILEVSTVVLAHYVQTGERLLVDDPETYTCCQEAFSNRYYTVVGGFSVSGLDVGSRRLLDYDLGVSCCREL